MKDLTETLTALAALPALAELTGSDAFWVIVGLVVARWYNNQTPATTR
jgi:hypothetical protein